MEKYKNEEYLKHEIMDQSRHQFIYGYDSFHRKEFLEEMAREYPVIMDNDSPMAIYVSEYGLPKISICNGEIDKMKLGLISQEFLSVSIASDILLHSKRTNDIYLLNQRMTKLINMLNKYNLNKGYSPMKNVDDLIKLLLESKEFYKSYYLEYYGKGKDNVSINDVALPFIQIGMFVSRIKDALKNNSYFVIIIDKQEDIATASTCAINFLVGGRINNDISMKVVTEPDKWGLYIDSNGQKIESVHDYGVVELDDSLSCYLKMMKR